MVFLLTDKRVIHCREIETFVCLYLEPNLLSAWFKRRETIMQLYFNFSTLYNNILPYTLHYFDHLPKVHKDVIWDWRKKSKCNHFIFNPAQLTCPAVLHHTPHATSSPCGPAISVAEAGHSHHQNPAPVTRLHPRETSSPGSGDTH